MLHGALERAGLKHAEQVKVGPKPGDEVHRADFVAWRPGRDDRKVIVSAKVQNASGTAEEKLLYELVKLLHAVTSQVDRTTGEVVRSLRSFTPTWVSETELGVKVAATPVQRPNRTTSSGSPATASPSNW